MKISKDLQIKVDKFRHDRKAYYSFLLLALMFIVTLPAELICNVRPLLIVVDGTPHFPVLVKYSEKDFGGTLPSEPDYLSQRFQKILHGIPETTATFERPAEKNSDSLEMDMSDFEEDGMSLSLGDFDEETSAPPPVVFSLELSDFEEGETVVQEMAPLPKDNTVHNVWILWPPIRYDYKYIPSNSKTGKVVLAAPWQTEIEGGSKTIPSSWEDGHYLGTDDRGRDILARLIYGMRISMVFGIALAITGTVLGCLIGGTQGFFGGVVDLVGQRLTEIWGSIPRLYILIILSAFLTPSALILFLILNLTAWMGIAAYIRAEFLKIRNFEFVKAAKALGVSNFGIMRRHILPNALTPVVTFFPFEVTAGILALVSLDYLNLGVPSPAPSMGELLAQGKSNLQATWIILPTFSILTITITLLTFVGEGIRNAFDPRRTV
ncbi:MAG: peptide ABC transporter permease [Nitrospinae bacterium CG11_big_fil_rev_8_21_14_0_20_45_15]|nr:MAG: peptide ABC transporter permease [Nitrospinae bacterium CG11_big_fil_rev_8_21_14_0_20_45_15]